MTRRMWVLVAAVAIAGAGLGFYLSQGGSSGSRQLIVTAAVTRRTLLDQVTLTGTVSRQVQRTVTASTAAQISDVPVKDGDVVVAGQSIIGIDGRESVAEQGSLPFTRSLGVGDSGADVTQLNQILADAGDDPGPVGSLFTTQTESALAEWQAAHGYPGIAADKPESLTVALQPGSSYSVGPQSSAGLLIAPAPAAGTAAAWRPGRGGPRSYFLASRFAVAGGPSPAFVSAATESPTLTIYALNPVTTKGTPAVFVVYSSTPAAAPISFGVSEGGDTPGDEVLPPTGPFVLPAGADSVEVQVPTRVNDLVQSDSRLTLTLTAGSGYGLGNPSAATTTVHSTDVPQLQVEGGGTVTPGGTATFRIVADQAPLQDTSVDFEVTGTAQPGQNFEPLPSSVVLRAGYKSVTVRVQTIDNAVTFQPTDMITGSWPIRVGQVLVKPGDNVLPGAGLFTLTDTDFTVTLSASPSDRTQLKVGQTATVQLSGGSAEASGVITELDDNATVAAAATGADSTASGSSTETYQGKISVGDLGAADGATVSINVDVQAADNVLTVPIAAVKQDGLGRDVVRVIDFDHGGHVDEVPVQTGMSDSSYIQIDSGLSEGEVVIVETDKISG